jgi:D-beta-D-heptose 7-phosphate kinase/D-beta-D-heptose 1-phosphate adenosyltransferase
MADKYIWTEDSPGAALRSPLLKAVREDYALGGAANVAHNLNALGAEVYLCGLVGYDDAAHWFRRGCHEAGIETSGIFPFNDRPTTLKVRVMSSDASSPLFRIDYEVTAPPNPHETASMRTYIEHYLPTVDAVVLSDYDKGIFGDLAFAREVLDKARELEKPTVVESKAHLYPECRGASLVILSDNQAETYFLKEMGTVPMEIESTGTQVRDKLGCEVLAILRDDRELWIHYVYKGAERHVVASVDANRILDPTGVKDTLTGVLTLSLVAGAAGADVPQAAYLAVCAAEAVVQKVGTATVALEDLGRACEKSFKTR